MHKIQRTYARYIKGRWYSNAAVVALIFTGVIVLVARLAVLHIESRQQMVQELVSQNLNAQVHIQRMKTGWHGLSPVLTLEDVEITGFNGQQGALSISSLDVMLDVWDSLRAFEFRTGLMVMRLSELDIHRDAQGHMTFNLHEVRNIAGQPESDLQILDWLLEQSGLKLIIDHVNLHDDMQVLPSVSLNALQIAYKKFGKRFMLDITAISPDIADDFRLTVDLDRDHLSLASLSGQVYLQANAVRFAPWRDLLASTVALPVSGNAHILLWAQFEAGALKQLDGNISLNSVVFAQSGDRHYDIKQLSARLGWRRDSNSWILNLGDISMQQQKRYWRSSGIRVMAMQEAGQHEYNIQAEYFELGDILPVIALQPRLSRQVSEYLSSLAPVGGIRNMKLRLMTQGETLQDFGIQARFRDLGIKADGEIPGIEGLDGELYATEKGGIVELQSKQASLNLTGIFRNPLPPGTLQGKLQWYHLDDGWLLTSKQLFAVNAHISTLSRLSVFFPQQGSPFIDIQTDFKDGDGSYTALYLPAKLMDEETVKWLDHGIVSGHIEYGSFILHGTLDDFPYDHHDGKFEVRFKVTDGILNYYEDWPALDEIEAEVVFSGRSMAVEMAGGKIFNADVHHTRVGINDLENDNPLLSIAGKVDTSSGDLVRYLSEIYPGGKNHTTFSGLEFSGDHRLELAIAIPLSEGLNRFRGQLDFRNNRLKVKRWNLQVERIQGRLSFNEKQFSAEDIQGHYLGKPVNVNVSTVMKPTRGQETHVVINTTVDIGKLVSDHYQPLKEQLKGSSDIELRIEIPDDIKTSSRLYVSSNLRGTAILLPAPLHKMQDAELPVRIVTGFSGEQARRIRLFLPETMEAMLHLSEDQTQIQALQVHLGNSDSLVNRQNRDTLKGLYITGYLSKLDVMPWWRWLDRMPKQTPPQIRWPLDVNVALDKLHLSGVEFLPLHINFQREGENGTLELSGEGAQGSLVLESQQGTLRRITGKLGRLAMVKLPDRVSDGDKGASGEKIIKSGDFRPSNVPIINVGIKTLLWNTRDLGSLDIDIVRSQDALKIGKLRLQNNSGQADVTGSWRYESVQQSHHTHLDIVVKSHDFGNLLSRFGYQDTFLGGKAEINSTLNMPVALPDIRGITLDGKVNFKLRDGDITEIKPGGVERVFGLLSFQTLPRRLALDFKDLFSKGMHFDRIDGSFVLHEGHAYTHDMLMDTPSGTVEAFGRIGLVDQDYDQLIKVTPKIGSSLPVASALAGGAGLGVVVYLANKLLENPIDKLTEIEYQLNGSWQEPNLQKIESIVKTDTVDQETTIPEPDVE